jgi:hypothetical protein
MIKTDGGGEAWQALINMLGFTVANNKLLRVFFWGGGLPKYEPWGGIHRGKVCDQ